MFEIIALLALFCALATLCILSVIDLREGLLPNEYVMAFAIQGAIFHLATAYHFLSIENMALGAAIGSGFLYVMRAVANWIYREDVLGLGDVKLMGAAGIWLGPYYILMALTIGAAAGLLHGIGTALAQKIKTGTMPSLNKLSLPAGPGFAAGILLTGMMHFQAIERVLWP
jgi:leader peptidase (prepilin peptidase)/N-methyltransferase